MRTLPQAKQYSMEVELQIGIPAAEVLSEFFRLAKASEEELEEVSVKQMDALRREERCYISRDENCDSSELATSFHRRMVIGVGMVEHSKLPEEFILFSASLPAFQIAEMSCGVACESGRLLEIRNLLWGCDNGEYLGDEEYLSLEQEGERILSDIFGTVFCHVLRAYGHDDIAHLYETDPKGYQVRCDAGRLFAVTE